MLPYSLIIIGEKFAVFVEFQLHVIVQFDIVTAIFLVDFNDDAVGELRLHVLGDGGGNDSGGDGGTGAFHLFPVTLKGEFHFRAIGKIDFIVVIHRGGKKLNPAEMRIDELLCFLWQLLERDRSVVGRKRIESN